MSAPLPDPSTFSSGESGGVAGVRRVTRAVAGDLTLNALLRMRRVGPRLDALASGRPPREVLVMCVYRPGALLAVRAAGELRASAHHVRLAFGATGHAVEPGLEAATRALSMSSGKFQNLNRLWAEEKGGAPDWVLMVDDDVVLPARFLDRFLAVCERFSLDLAQPAQTLRSHAAWRITRRRARPILRETRFVEIGPVTAFSARAARELIPFPDTRFGWGLELAWAAVAEEHGWRRGIVDALPVRHESQPVASTYGHAEALAEAQRFLAERPYLPRAEALEVLAEHARLPR